MPIAHFFTTLEMRKGVKWNAFHFDSQGYDRRSFQTDDEIVPFEIFVGLYLIYFVLLNTRFRVFEFPELYFLRDFAAKQNALPLCRQPLSMIS